MNFLLSLLAWPALVWGMPSAKKISAGDTVNTSLSVVSPVDSAAAAPVAARWVQLYERVKLQQRGLKKEVFQRAYTGYMRMLNRGMLARTQLLTICDLSQSSRRKRLYVIDLENEKLVVNSLVAHGQGSGGEYANSFGNDFDSHKSSLGFYTTGEVYYGEHGYSLRLRGHEPGFNDNAYARDVVVHPSDYVSEEYVRGKNTIGRSWGCPAIPEKNHQKVINLIRNGSCFFVHYPAKNYLKKSRFLN